MKPWKIFYSDGSTFGINDGPVEEAPREGFLCALGYSLSDKRYIMHRWDFYRYDEESDQFWGMDIWGVIDWLGCEVEPGYPTKFSIFDGVYDLAGVIYEAKNRRLLFEGRTVTQEDWQAVCARADSDPDFPLKLSEREVAA